MDPAKSSHPSKGPELNNVMAPEENAPGDKSERQREEEKETDTDAPDGLVTVTSNGHRRAPRYNTIGYPKKKQRTVVDFATVSKGASTGAKSRGALKQVLFSQGASDKNVTQEERAGSVQGQVDTLKQVLDTLVIPSDLRWTWGEGGSERTLEQSWTDIVHSHESMSKPQRHQQEALWELLNTELSYINKLTIAKDLVLAALSHVRGRGFLQEVSATMLFSNLPSILQAHRLFWQEVMYPMLQEVRLTGQPFDPLRLESGCLQFQERFSAYFEYCLEEERNVEFTRKLLDTNPQFHAYLTWVENHPQCGRMRLGDIQAKPHQRITKYPLLLKAVLKTTEDLPTQNALHRMLNSVNNFLESINDYLQFKDDELALSVAAQRIEEYKMEGLSEEIDKHVQEICCFNLTSPMRGVGPKVIRKQLLEETLKVRGRKDNKLELVVLLFTDVLLMTKTQKKSDKLKVVRPPLPVERIHCTELKDGYSFVLVEVGDLGCAVSVYCVSTPSPDSCSTWVSVLREAKMALNTLRKNEANRTVRTIDETEHSGLQRHPTQERLNKVKEDQSESDSDVLPLTEPHLNRTDSLSENRAQTLMDAEQMNYKQAVERKSSPLIGQQNDQSQLAHGGGVRKRDSGRIDSAESKPEERNRKDGKQLDDGEAPFRKITERRVTWNHTPQPKSNDIMQRDLFVRNQSNEPYTSLPKGQMEKNGTPNISTPSTLSNKPLLNKTQHGATVETGSTMHPDQEDLSQSQEARRGSAHSESSEDDRLLTESRQFKRGVNSPRIRVKRLNDSQPSVSPDNSTTVPGGNGLESIPNTHSESDQRRGSNSSIKPQDSHRVFKLGSLRNNNGVIFNVPEERSSSDVQTLSEPEETPEENFQTNPKLKAQRSASIPESGSPYASSARSSDLPSHRLSPSPPPGLDLQLHPSPLQGLLQRAKDREKERGIGKKQGKAQMTTLRSLQNSPSLSGSPSPSVSEGEREAEESDTRSWREGSTDGKKRKESSNVPEGISVDWPGWCFDDEDVFDFQEFEYDWLEQTLTAHELRGAKPKGSERQDDGECSEV